jgi:hypothetical protein
MSTEALEVDMIDGGFGSLSHRLLSESGLNTVVDPPGNNNKTGGCSHVIHAACCGIVVVV